VEQIKLNYVIEINSTYFQAVIRRKETNTNGFMNTKQAVSYGPWGGNGGNIFDDGVYTGVREVHLTRYGGVVSIRICYDLNGKEIWGSKNGGSGGIRVDKVPQTCFKTTLFITVFFPSDCIGCLLIIKPFVSCS
jgi:hypothetical protein